jgi:hypothetical protein
MTNAVLDQDSASSKKTSQSLTSSVIA